MFKVHARRVSERQYRRTCFQLCVVTRLPVILKQILVHFRSFSLSEVTVVTNSTQPQRFSSTQRKCYNLIFIFITWFVIVEQGQARHASQTWAYRDLSTYPCETLPVVISARKSRVFPPGPPRPLLPVPTKLKLFTWNSLICRDNV